MKRVNDNNLSVRECHGMLAFVDKPDKRGNRLSLGVNLSRVRFFSTHYDWSQDVDEEQYDNLVNLVKKESCFLLEIKSQISSIEVLDDCFLTNYHERVTYYYFYDMTERALKEFYGVP